MDHNALVDKLSNTFDLESYCISHEHREHTQRYCTQDRRYPKDTSSMH